MTDYALCSGCQEIMTPVGCVCLDCAFPVAAYYDAKAAKQAREQYVQSLRDSLEATQESLRDRFAMAGLSALQIREGTMYPEVFVSRAYAIADEMIRVRKKP